ncbi:hypothetical protein niasHT_009435 [Heterodera trifolii]|uniref:GPI ethanolamine phosphate transferase 3 n=1 Tax=Heterodera trifolii TaxID=157864 RepID=A0ABD2MEM5_9BILA
MRRSSSAISKSLILRLLALTLSYSVSLLIFQRGLLVKRHILPHRSSCEDIVAREPRQCWTEARFSKVILLIVDALRFDFILPSNGLKNDSTAKYYTGKMPFVAKLLNSSNAGLFALLSDAPTTTFQRIKALVTGSVPAFIEASDNFGGSEIGEDNLIDQLISCGRNITMLGDDTWLQLLPGRFNRHFEGPSFDIKDLDTVDNIVFARIYDELNRTDWSLLIAHCLGVDHAGHRYGPMHPEMARKLGQMDELVRNVTSKMSDDAVLFVLGDHGMTQTGDHGGDSPAEITTALLVYAKGLNILTNLSDILTVHQVDIVPTLSLLLGVPIPFSSIGLAIDSLLPQNSLHELRLNSFQLIRYAQQYFHHYPPIQVKLRHIMRQYETAADDFHSNLFVIKSIQKLLRLSLDQFHFSICVVGLISLLESVLFNGFLLLDNADEWISIRLWVFRSALLFLQLSLVFAAEPSVDTVLFSVTSLAVSLCSQTVVLSYKIFAAVTNKYSPFPSSPCLTLFANFVLSLLPLSNSFVIYESDVLRFSLQSVICIILLYSLNTKRSFNLRNVSAEMRLALLLLFITRFLKAFENCREEQVGCVPVKFASHSAFLLSVLFVLGVLWALFERFSPRVHSLTKAFVWSMAVFLILHWAFELSALSFVESGFIESASTDFVVSLGNTRLIESVSRRLAQFVYFAFFVHLLVFRWLSVSASAWVWPHFHALAVPLVMLSGYSYGQIISVIVFAFAVSDPLTSSESVWTGAFLLHLIALLSFYATGHHQTLNSIPWHAAFVGLPGNFPFKWLSALLIFFNMFSGKMLASLLAFAREREDTIKGPLCLLFFGGMRVFGSSLAALTHHKHLMFFKVFAPKFVFEAADFIFCCALIVFWAILRVKEPIK